MWRYYDKLEVWLDSLSTGDWFWVFAAAVGIGALCLRGFGSRKNY